MSRAYFVQRILRDFGRRPRRPNHRPAPTTWADDAVTGSCLGHSTVLLNVHGVRLLTDPIFSPRAGPGWGPFVAGFKRHLAPALPLRDTPPPHVIVLSHAHFDHFDTRSLRPFARAAPHTPVVTASRTEDLVQALGFRTVHALAWGQRVSVDTPAGPIDLTALEVRHWGARWIEDNYRGYNGYLIERAGRRVCFAGDTAYTRAFARLHDPKRPLDLALMPIGAYNPWVNSHCNPEEAVAMADLAGARHFVPIHHETFELSNEPFDEPARRLHAALVHRPGHLLATHVGETFTLPH